MLSSYFKRSANIMKTVIGPLETNCYLVEMEENTLLIDPADQPKFLTYYLQNKKPKTYVDMFLTHGHIDHIYGVPGLSEDFPFAKIYASKKDEFLYNDPNVNFSITAMQSTTLKHLSKRIENVVDNQIIKIGKDEFTVLELPGHTPGCIGLYSKADKCVFVGDTLFLESIGAANGPRSDFWAIVKSIKTKLFTLPDDTIVFPGHGPSTTIGHEKKNNPFLIDDA